MDSFIPLRISRSDGQGYNIDEMDEHSKPEEKTKSTQNRGEYAMKWKIMIGRHLRYQLGPAGDELAYMLWDFPPGYELRIQEKGGKFHTYMYGHPKDAKARYRTHGDFVPHLLWLISDSVDRLDCSCHLCVDMTSKGEYDANRVAMLSAASTGTPPVAPGQNTIPAGPHLAAAAPVQVPQKVALQKPAHQQPAHQAPPPALQQPTPQVPQAPQAPQAAQPTHQQPAPQQVPGQQEHPRQGHLHEELPHQQQVQLAAVLASRAPSSGEKPWASLFDLAPPGTISQVNIFRVGELVWYKEAAWRLGVVLALVPKGGHVGTQTFQDETNFKFIVAPLGHSSLAKPNAIKEAADMRPFLTFSIPGLSIQELSGRAFTNVNWPSFITDYIAKVPDTNPAVRARRLEALGLEASKMAARLINSSFSMFNRIHDDLDAAAAAAANKTSRKYAGVYLGAEMIVLGDAIRVVPSKPSASGAAAADNAESNGIAVMIVHEIIMDVSAPEAAPTLHFRGDVYRLGHGHPAKSSELALLGPVCLEELNFRNTLSKATNDGGNNNNAQPQQQAQAQGPDWTWTLLERRGVRDEADVHGRFYVTPRLMEIVDPARLQLMQRQRAVEDSDAFLNNRMHNGGDHHAGWREGRAETLGQSVAAKLVLPDGLLEETF